MIEDNEEVDNKNAKHIYGSLHLLHYSKAVTCRASIKYYVPHFLFTCPLTTIGDHWIATRQTAVWQLLSYTLWVFVNTLGCTIFWCNARFEKCNAFPRKVLLLVAGKYVNCVSPQESIDSLALVVVVVLSIFLYDKLFNALGREQGDFHLLGSKVESLKTKEKWGGSFDI